MERVKEKTLNILNKNAIINIPPNNEIDKTKINEGIPIK